ncbi:hypothetical protein NL676_020185 [Syzygium grande]|nr:hypothetical protein NL676_020185 [Syzygium grande]
MRFQEIMNETNQIHISVGANIGDFLPFFRRIRVNSSENRMMALQEKRDEFMQSIVEEHKRMQSDDQEGVAKERTLIKNNTRAGLFGLNLGMQSIFMQHADESRKHVSYCLPSLDALGTFPPAQPLISYPLPSPIPSVRTLHLAAPWEAQASPTRPHRKGHLQRAVTEGKGASTYAWVESVDAVAIVATIAEDSLEAAISKLQSGPSMASVGKGEERMGSADRDWHEPSINPCTVALPRLVMSPVQLLSDSIGNSMVSPSVRLRKPWIKDS